jgi:uncharacterized membrane protein
VLIAAIGDTGYDLLLVLHILAVVVTFAPAAINPLLERHFERNGGEPVLANWAGFTSFYTSRIALPGLVVVLLTGVFLILASDEIWEFSQTWISLAFLVWIAIGGVVSAMILKGEKQLAAGDMSGRQLVARGGAIATVLLVVMLYLMVFKPGL